MKYKVLEALDENEVLSLEDLKKEWMESYEDIRNQDPSYSLKEFMHTKYYDESQYLLDIESGFAIKANDYFMHVVRQLLH